MTDIIKYVSNINKINETKYFTHLNESNLDSFFENQKRL